MCAHIVCLCVSTKSVRECGDGRRRMRRSEGIRHSTTTQEACGKPRWYILIKDIHAFVIFRLFCHSSSLGFRSFRQHSIAQLRASLQRLRSLRDWCHYLCKTFGNRGAGMTFWSGSGCSFVRWPFCTMLLKILRQACRIWETYGLWMFRHVWCYYVITLLVHHQNSSSHYPQHSTTINHM